MSSVLGKPSGPKLPPMPEEIEAVEVVEEEAEEVRRREKKKLATRGRRATILSGIASALKKRLGE